MLRNNLFKPWFYGEKDWGFEIVEGEYSGVCVQIEKVEFSKTDPSGLDLEYHIINRPEVMREEFSKEDNFIKTVEVIINDILREAVEDYEQSRNSNPEESGSQ